MKSATPAMKSHLVKDCTTICRLYKITRTDGTIYTFTDHDKNIDTSNYQSYLDDGGYIYEAAVGFSPTASENKSDLSVDNQEATCFIDSETITERDLRYGLWDAAEVEIRVVNWSDLTNGEVKVRKGSLGNATIKNGVLTSELLGLTNKLQILLGRSYGTPCDAELGDSRCKATVPVETAHLNANPSVGINDPHHITPYSGLTGAAGYYNDGIITFPNGSIGGPNAGLSFQIKSWDGITLTLDLPLFATPTDGDEFLISPGCGHNVFDCFNKFNNLDNHRGFPTIPGQDSILNYPNSTG